MTLNKEKNCVPIEFDYLDEKHGVVIQLIHTGKTSDDIKVIGDIKGVKKLQNKFPNPKWAKMIKNMKIKSFIRPKVFAVFSVCLGALYVVINILILFFGMVQIRLTKKKSGPQAKPVRY